MSTPFARSAPFWKPKSGLAHVLSEWEHDAGMRRSFVLDETFPAAPPTYADVPTSLAEPVRKALAARGIERLYGHQARAYELASAGRDVVVATPTASGKSLAYHLPVLDRLATEPNARALYLFPTKALSRDQEESLRKLLGEAGLAHGAITYDGDTPGDARRAARDRSGVLLTNPDMLHAGILPHHASWARLFSMLRFVVVDELHTYRGVFGSHFANVLRRLDRVARFHGSSPTFVFASATIGNPKEHASRMLGREVQLVDENGAGHGPKRLLVYNPPIVNAELGIRASYSKSTVRIAGDLVAAGVSTLVFGQSRNTVETMLKYLRDRLTRDKLDPELVHGYRGGYLPETRRRIESDLREGRIRCVVATNALELGIDVGSLDAVVCAGYPGSIASLFQRFGRAGRRGDASVAIMVASSAPLDQYLAGDPRTLLRRGAEEARIDPDNVEILVQHVKCAAFELPFEEGEPFGNVPPDSATEVLGFLAQHELVFRTSDARGRTVYHWSADAYPASHVSLRSAGWDNFVIVDLDQNQTIAEMDFRAVHTMLHVQAIYQHAGLQYQVERLDFDNHKAFVRKVEPDYYTDALTSTQVTVIEDDDGAIVHFGGAHALAAGRGDVSIVEKVIGYKKIKFHTHENVGYGDVHLPEMQMHTTAFWLTFPESLVTSLPYARPVVVDALRGFSSAMHTVAAVGLMIDPHDLGRTLGGRVDPDAPPAKGGSDGPGFDPTIFLYDHVPGGIGLAPRLFDQREELLRRARSLFEGCDCEDGCPACIGPEIGLPQHLGGAHSVEKRKSVVRAILDAIGVAVVH